MYPIQNGSIYVDGKEISEYNLKNLRSRMSIIPQFGFLYNASLKDNLDPEDLLSKESVQEIIK